MRGRKLYLAVLAVSLLVGVGTFLFGCFGSDDEKVAAPPPPQQTGFALTSATMVQAAEVSANEVEFFNRIAAIFASLVAKLPTPAAPASGPAPLLPIPLPGGSGLCLPGATVDNVTFNDNDNDTIPSAGDTLTVNLQNCAFAADPSSILSGAPNPAIKFTITDNVVGPVIIGTLDINLTSVSSFDPTDSTTIKGSMRASFSGLSFPAADIILGKINGTAANTFASFQDSAGRVDFGCFDVKLNFPNVANPFDFTTSVRGVAKINTLAIMQLGDYAVESDPSPLNFVDGIPVSGKLKLLSFDSRASVPGLSSCYGTVTGTTSELVTALVGNSIQLETFKNTTWSGTPDNTITTTWSSLTF